MKLGINAINVQVEHSGLATYARSIVRHLLEIHNDVVLYVSDPGVFPLEKTHRVPVGSRENRGSKIFRVFGGQLVMPFWARGDRISLLLSPSPLEGLPFSLVPQVTVVHDLIPLLFPEEYPRVRHFFKRVLPLILRSSLAIITVSEHTRQDLLGLLNVEPKKVQVIYNGCDKTAFNPGADGEEARDEYGLGDYVLYVGNQLPHKNLARLIEAFGLSSAARNGFRLVIAGRKDQRFYPALRAQVQQLSLQNKVLFLGYVPSEDLPGLYRGAAALVLVSLYEGFGLTPLEAMACGTPVIVSKVASLPEVIGGAGLFVDPWNPCEIADAIDRILGDLALRQELIPRGLERVKEFSWARCAEQTLAICKRIQSDG